MAFRPPSRRERRKKGRRDTSKKNSRKVFFFLLWMRAIERLKTEAKKKHTVLCAIIFVLSAKTQTDSFLSLVSLPLLQRPFFSFSPSQSFLVLTFLPVYLTCLFVFFLLSSSFCYRFFFLSLSLPPVRQHIDARREILHWLFIARLFNAHRRGKKKSRREKKEEEKPCPQLSRLPMRRPT